MDKQIMVSVVMTTYNHERFVEQALDGVAKQAVDFDYEIVLHDDASPDNTQAIVRAYLEKHPDLPIVTIFQTENQHSKRTGIFASFIYPKLHGKYIIVCEGDDYWIDEHKLQKQVDILEQHPEYVGVGHNCLTVNEDNEPIETSVYACYGPFREHVFRLRELATGFLPGQTATLLYRREVFLSSLRSHFDDYYSIRTNGDKRRNLELLLLGDIYYLEEKMSAYRISLNGGSSWSANHYYLNRMYNTYIDTLDCRRYARKVFHRHLPNEYFSFHAVMIALMRRFNSPTEENKEVVSKIIAENHGIIRFLLYTATLGIVAIPQFIRYKISDKTKYLLT